jgi:hypothetical protein
MGESSTVAIVVTKHARKRCRERMGLSSAACARTAHLAWERGLPVRVRSDWSIPKEHAHTFSIMRAWNNFLFVFASDGAGGVVLVTVIPRRSQTRPEGLHSEIDRNERAAICRRRKDWSRRVRPRKRIETHCNGDL